MSVVQLDSYLVGEFAPRSLALLEAANYIIEGSCHPEVLLLQAKLFTTIKIVVRIQHSTDGLSTLLISNGTLIVATIELLEIEFSTGSFTGPKTQIVRSRCVESRNRNIVSDSLDNFTAFPDYNILSLLILIFSGVAIKLNLQAISWTA